MSYFSSTYTEGKTANHLHSVTINNTNSNTDVDTAASTSRTGQKSASTKKRLTFKAPTPYEIVKPSPNRMEILSQELGLDYDGNGSLSSDEDSQHADTDTKSVQYQALKRQLKCMESEREQLLLKISKFKEKNKIQEKQLNKLECERRSQLNVMKNTHEQAVVEQKKLVKVFEDVIRDQETELDILRANLNTNAGFKMPLNYPLDHNSTAVTRITSHLNQVISEKNDILAQFCSQQQLIKDQQLELKSLLRCRAENTDLSNQISTLNKSMSVMTGQMENTQNKLDRAEQQRESLVTELEKMKQLCESKITQEAADKLTDQVTKFEDKLLLREAEMAELDFNYRQKLQAADEKAIEKEQLIRQLKQELHQAKSQSQKVVERVKEVPVESESLKEQLRESQASAKAYILEQERNKLAHINEIDNLKALHREDRANLEEDLRSAKEAEAKLISTLYERDEREEKIRESFNNKISDLELQLKHKKSETAKLRQEMADQVVEWESKRDTDLEQLETRLRHETEHKINSYHNVIHQMKLKIIPHLVQLQQDNRHLRSLHDELRDTYQIECVEASRKISQAVHDVNEHNKDLVRKYRKEMALRKKYHNELVELKGNIRVFCRIRPIIKEDGPSATMVLTTDNDDEDILIVANRQGRSQRFEMDKLFTSDISQTQVFNEVKSLVTSCVDGYHVCIFAYGQTGSGKTYTMEGPVDDPGINQRALSQLFQEADDRSKDWKFDIRVSVIEIYNETVRDLLGDQVSDKLEIKLNQNGHLHVPGLTWVVVSSVSDINTTFLIGHKNRATACTNMNEHSSRSHALLCVEVTGVNKTTGAKTLGKLNLVDLAGSERVSKSGADGARLKEAQAINKSLSALGDVISALRSKQTFIPYRNSKLTYLLQDSLGGDSKVLMIAQVAPVDRHVNETLCSLNFAQRVRTVELGMAGKKMESAELSALKEKLAQYEGQSPVSTPTKSLPTSTQGTPHKKR